MITVRCATKNANFGESIGSIYDELRKDRDKDPTCICCGSVLSMVSILYSFVLNSSSRRTTRGARSPHLQVAITQAWHICSPHSFGISLKMTEKRPFGPSSTHYLIIRVLNFYLVKLT